jgi:outer membrane protein assembly factor BamA
VAALLDSATLALPDTTTFDLHPYRVRFTPDYVSRPTIGYERDNFGRGVFGGTAIEMSDILGNNMLVFSGAVNGRISEAQVLAAYANMGHRWNYVLGVSQDPLFYYGASSCQGDCTAGSSNFVLDQQLQRLVLRQAFAQAFYPLSRFQRIELGMRYTNVGVSTLHFLSAIQNGAIVAEADSTSNDASLSLVQPSVALVYDNSLFGYTSPFYGKRYRFEVAPVVGDWRYVQRLADYRRYDLIKFPFTFATRAQVLARMGRDGDRFPVFIGSPDLVRGYTLGSYDATMCSTGCPELDQLVGSRIAVFSAEFRFFLVRNLTLGFLPIGFPPIEGALWYDAGLAWNGTSTVRLDRSPGQNLSAVRSPVTSYGVGLRANLFGLAILRVDYAVPNQRPGHGGYWILSLGPPF